jgi:hypothetical protein
LSTLPRQTTPQISASPNSSAVIFLCVALLCSRA